MHNYSTNIGHMIVGGEEFIRLERDLTDGEACTIELFSQCHMSVPEMETNLISIFPERRFEKALLHRIKTRTLDESLGNERHNLPNLANTAEDVVQKGGVFAIVPDPESCGVDSIHVQYPSWRDYSMQYCCDWPKMIDDSHQYSQYNIKAIPTTGIDGLGWSFIAGCTYNLTKNSSCITDLLFLHKSWSFHPGRISSHVAQSRLLHKSCRKPRVSACIGEKSL